MSWCLKSPKLAAILMVLVWATAWSANTKKTLTFTAEDSSQYTVSHSENLIFENDRLNLVADPGSGGYPYIELKSNEARQFLRMKSLRQYGQNIYGVRYIISNDAGTTWYWLNQDSPSDWVVSNGTYQQATSFDGTFLLINKFRKRGANDEFVFRIFFAFPQGYDETEDSVDGPGIVALDSIEIEYDNNREVTNVIFSTDTVVQTILAHDTVVRNIFTHDTIVNTIVRTDTVTAIRTVVETDTVEKTIVQRDTLLRVDTIINVVIQKDTITHTNTVVFRDTVVNVVVVHDTVSRTDTLVHRDTILNTVVHVDSVIITNTVSDTINTVETVVLHDTLYSTIVKQDTLVRFDTIYQVLVQRDTVRDIDTVIKTDTLVHKVVEVMTVALTDTVVQKDTVYNTVHEIDTVLQTEIVRDTVVLTQTRIDTVVKEVLPYPDFNPDCDTCRAACGKPIVVEAGDSVELHALAFNDSGEFIGELPWPQQEPDTGCDGSCGQAFSPEKALDEFVQVGPWYYHLIVKPSIMVKIKIHVLIEGNLIELRNYRTHPGDTLVLVAVGEDSFGNQIGEVDVDWFATGDSAGAEGIGAFVGNKAGTRTKIVAGPSLGQLGFRFEGQTIITPDSVEMDIVLLTNPVAHVVVRDSSGGHGNRIDELNMTAGDTISLYVAAYDSNWVYMNDLAVWWEGDGVVKDHISLALNNSLLVSPEQNGTGYLKMAYQSGATGRITVIVEVEVSVSVAYRLEIRTGPNGTGTLLDSLESDVFSSIGQILNLYGSVVDQYGNHIVDTVVQWSASAQYGVDINTAIDSGGNPYARVAADAIGNYNITASLPGVDTVSTDSITVLPPIETIKIRTAANNGGRELSAQDTSITVDTPLSLYAAGYDSVDAYVGDVSVTWNTSDTAQHFSPQLTQNFVFAPKKPGLGKIDALLEKADDANNLADTTGDISVAIGNPAYVTIQQEPLGIALNASYQFSAIVTDWAGNQIVNTPIAWSAVGDPVGTFSANGKLTTTAEGEVRVIAAYGALRDTTPVISVVDGYPMTDQGGTYVFDEGVKVIVPAQGGLDGNILDVDLEPAATTMTGFVKVRGPLSFEDCTKEYFASPVTIRFSFAQGNLDTLTALGKTTADIRLYRYNAAMGEWQVEHAGINQADSQRVSVTTYQIYDKYVLGVDMSSPTMVVTMADTVKQGVPFNVTGIVTDNMMNCKAYVYSKRYSDATYSVDSVQLSGLTDTFTVTIPGPTVSEQGTAIMVKVSDGHSFVYSGDGSSQSAIGPVVRVSNVIYPQVIPETTWVVFSLPYTPSVTSPKQFFSMYGQFKMHWDLAKIINGALVEYDTTAENFKLEAGGLYWFATSASGTVLRIPSGFTQSPDDTFKVTVASKKWAGLGVPYPAAISVADIRKTTGADTTKMKGAFMYTDGTAWEATLDTLLPWRGYYVYNSSTSPMTIKFPPVRMQNLPAAKRMLAAAGEWIMGVAVKAGKRMDDEKLLGAMPGDCPELFSTPMPPAGKNPAAGFVMSLARPNQADAYFTDFRGSSQAGNTWTANLAGMTVGKGATMEFRDIRGALPAGFKMVVLDETRGMKFDVTETRSFSFVSDKAQGSLKIVAGSREYVDANTAGFKPAPMAFALSPNYPNPFNPITSIRFQVPNLKGNADMPGAEWAVLKVYNMRGQEIKTLVNSPVQAGYYTVTWDAKDYQNRPCATGNYIYHMQIGNTFRKSLRMTLLK